MANVVTHPHPQSPPHPNLMSYTPSLGFGFGMSATPSLSTWPTSPPTLGTVANQTAPARNSKRRLEHDEEDTETGNRHMRDDAMDRSPTPERPKRAAPKRARTTPTLATISKNEKDEKSGDASDVDVGVLLGTCLREL